MGVVAIGLGLYESRAFTRSRPGHRFLHSRQHLQRVIPVDRMPREAVSLSPVGDLAGHLLVTGHGYGVLVVLDYENQRKVVNPGPVHCFMPVALGGRAFTAVDHGDGTLASHLQPVSDARSMGELGTDHRRLGEDPSVRVRPMARELTTT